jgi:hypothetical protein
MECTTAVSTQPQVTVGVDAHKQFHVARAADELGRPLGSHRVAASTAGYRQLVSWARGLGQIVIVGIEGPGHFGAGLARYLRGEGIAVTEVGRPKRQRRARTANPTTPTRPEPPQSCWPAKPSATPSPPTVLPKMVRVLWVARTSAVRARAKSDTATAGPFGHRPAPLREELAGLCKSVLSKVQTVV